MSAQEALDRLAAALAGEAERTVTLRVDDARLYVQQLESLRRACAEMGESRSRLQRLYDEECKLRLQRERELATLRGALILLGYQKKQAELNPAECAKCGERRCVCDDVEP